MNRCTWTETITFETFINEPHYDEIKNEQRQRQCENMTDEQFDEYRRAYCKEHRIKVDEINKTRHKNCVNKEKLIKELKNINKNLIKELKLKETKNQREKEIITTTFELSNLFQKLENGEFDNE